MRLHIAALCLAASLSSQPAVAQHQNPYVGQERRPIKALSEQEIADLKRGAGMGLAKAAELNGAPGPAHLLELKNELSLTADQIALVDDKFKNMLGTARVKGEELIAQEAELERRFAAGAITRQELADLLSKIAGIQKDLRFIHLAAHIDMLQIVTRDQVAAYNKLRGYTSGGVDTCANPPAGHDLAMWRKHNNCR